MAQPKLIALDHPELAPFTMSERLRSQLVYFQAASNARGCPELGEGEYWFDRDEVAKWLDDGVFYLVSPLDTENATEVELTEEQENLLGWLAQHEVRHAKVD